MDGVGDGDTDTDCDGENDADGECDQLGDGEYGLYCDPMCVVLE